MKISKLGKLHVISFDIEDIAMAWSKGGYPFLLDDEVVDSVLTGAIEDSKEAIEELMHKFIEDQLFKPKRGQNEEERTFS
jgi:hypothetical protein